MQLGLPEFPKYGTLDFDAPAVRIVGEEQFDELVEGAEKTGQPIAADLSYFNDLWGYLRVRDGRNVAQIESAPTSPEECALSANLGGFTSAKMSEWPLKLHDRFCFLTDQGNVASAEITEFIGGEKDSYTGPPSQIEFTATLWKRS
ncbi:hypothetical protein [Streptomyces abyssomicinicus]|uniref:hypothetical protein n=1 Tax=Streptomyces abyssomicinicus TaxID=574929 RepID=UPI001C3FDE9A|nr:hypothetical protein [Streptomyces abyssomicinicus]